MPAYLIDEYGVHAHADNGVPAGKRVPAFFGQMNDIIRARAHHNMFNGFIVASLGSFKTKLQIPLHLAQGEEGYDLSLQLGGLETQSIIEGKESDTI